MSEFDRQHVPVERLPGRRRDAVPLRRRRRGVAREVPRRATTRCAERRSGPVDDRRRARRSSTRCVSSRTRRTSASSAAPREMSAQGHIRAMQAAAPGKWEFEVQAGARRLLLRATASRRMAYPSIAGSGPNSCILHYDQSTRQMKDGEVLLNDSGAEYGCYATDITRTYPVNGKFSPEQRAIYDIVLAAQKAAMALVKPGATHEEVEKAARESQRRGPRQAGPAVGRPGRARRSRSGTASFTLHGVSHWVGLDVHDAGPYASRARQVARRSRPGMVFTIEPGIYIPANSQGVDPEVVEHRRADRGHDPRHEGRLRVPVLRAPRARSRTSRRRSGRAGRRPLERQRGDVRPAQRLVRPGTRTRTVSRPDAAARSASPGRSRRRPGSRRGSPRASGSRPRARARRARGRSSRCAGRGRRCICVEEPEAAARGCGSEKSSDVEVVAVRGRRRAR